MSQASADAIELITSKGVPFFAGFEGSLEYRAIVAAATCLFYKDKIGPRAKTFRGVHLQCGILIASGYPNIKYHFRHASLTTLRH